MEAATEPKYKTSGVRLTRLEQWWANLLPLALRNVLPPWFVSAILATLVAVYVNAPLLTTCVALAWASTIFAFSFRYLVEYIGQHRWVIPVYHALLYSLVASPVLAQSAPASACTGTGLFSGLTNFVSTLFSTVTFGGVGGGTLSGLICQVVGFLVVGLLLGFLGVLGTMAFQIGYQRQPVSQCLDPLWGFLIFAGGATIMISVMVGTATP